MYRMREAMTLVHLGPDSVSDTLGEVLRDGAQRMLQAASEERRGIHFKGISTGDSAEAIRGVLGSG